MRYLFILLFVLLLVGCTEVAPGNYIVIPVTGTLEGTYESVCYGEDCWNAQLVTATPVPTDVFPSPTPEELPTSTPTPIATPLPKCAYLITTPALNVRIEPGGTILGQVFEGQTVAVDAYWTSNGIRWYKIWWDENTDGYIHSGYTQQVSATDCSSLEDVTPKVLLGFHLIVGSNDSFILGGSKVGGAKGTSHTQNLLDLLRSVNPSAITIYRSLHNSRGMVDGPTYDEWYHPDKYYNSLKPYIEWGNTYVEYINEWGLPKLPDGKDDWEQWERFTIRMLELFAADGQCALFGSFGPGAPDIPGWHNVVNVMRWIDVHPCGAGKYHGWATHTTLPMPAWVNVNPGSYIRNPWIIERDLIFRDWALANENYDLADFKGGVFVTEGGWTDYSVPFDRDFTCEEVVAGWKLTEADYRVRRPWVKLVALWTLTREGDPAWYNLQPCLPLFFN